MLATFLSLLLTLLLSSFFVIAHATALTNYSDEISSPSLPNEDQLIYDSVLLKNHIKQIKGIIQKIDTRRKTLSVQVMEVRENKNIVRVGDTTKNYSFDNITVLTYDKDKKTAFTYGDKTSDASSLKEGDEVVIALTEDKPIKINATKRIQGIIEQIDIKHETLKVKVGEKHKKIPFRYLQIFTADGKLARVQDIRTGDSVVLNINMGYSEFQ